jgi:protein SCO1/2
MCPDICPTTLAQLAEVRKKLGPAGKDFQVVYVTVDPERDTVQRLNQYVTGFDPTFIGVTGTIPELEQVRKDYGIFANRKYIEGSKTAYLIHHSSFIYLLDGDGKLRAMSPYGRQVDDVVSDVKALMKK